MNFDPLILFFIIILIAFILPSIFKKIIAEEKTKTSSDRSTSYGADSIHEMKSSYKKIGAGKIGEKKVSLFEKITMQTRQFMQEAVKQAQQQKRQQKLFQQEKQQQNIEKQEIQVENDTDVICDVLAEKIDDDFDESPTITPENKSTGNEQKNSLQTGETLQPIRQEHGDSGEYSISNKSGATIVSYKIFRLKKNPLQNAVIWSEILSKPVALKKKS